MPYNPGSAYPRKTVYVPPTYGEHAFPRAVNAPDFTHGAGATGGIMTPRGKGVHAGLIGELGGIEHPNAAVGMEATMRRGIIGKLQDRYMETRGLKQNQGGAAKPDAAKSPAEVAADQLPRGDWDGGGGTVEQTGPVGSGTPTHGNPAAQQRRAAAGALADEITEQVLTGDMPGDTGRANTRKSKKKINPGQQTLPF